LLGISEDITDRRLAQEELLHGKKLQAVGLLAAGVAHQINNPLAVILGFAEILLGKVTPGHPFYEALASITRETQRCCGLIKDLLSFSRQKAVSSAPVNPRVVLDSALSLIDSQALIKKIRLIRDVPDDLPDFEVDAQQIQQVLINLCLNAMDAMPKGGTLTVKARARHDETTGMRTPVEISVIDTGTGIPSEIRSRIFEPFFTTKSVGKGTGLGLSLCYGIIKSHHGQIDVESEVGKGTTFIVCLPLHQPQHTSREKAA